MLKSKIYWYLIPVTLLVGILIGHEIHSYLNTIKSPDSNEKIDQVLRYAVDYYYDEVDTNALIENAIDGILEDLDPHSIYIPQDQQIGITEQFRGNYDGIGIEFQIINDTISVVSAISGGPGESVGILPGDRIVEINDNSAIGFTNSEVIANLRGNKGTSVKLKVFRPYLNELLDVVIIRDQVPLATVSAYLMMNDSIGYIALSKFAETSIYEMKSALDKLSGAGMKRLIIDLRNNPGGYLDQAVNIADLFIEGDKLIVYTKGRVTDFDAEYYAKNTYEYEKLPLAVLVNKGSASASEILTGALKDWGRGMIVGERTFGKGLVQRPFKLKDESVVRITISKYYTPSGNEIQRDFEDEADYFGVIYADVPDSIKNSEAHSNTDTIRSDDQGGIIPDILVNKEELTYYTAVLTSKDLFFQYSRKYLDTYRGNIVERYNNDLKNFVDDFSLSENDFQSFIEFSERNGVKLVKRDFNKDKKYIGERIKAFIARDIWKNYGWYLVNLKSDKQFLEAFNKLQDSVL